MSNATSWVHFPYNNNKNNVIVEVVKINEDVQQVEIIKQRNAMMLSSLFEAFFLLHFIYYSVIQKIYTRNEWKQASNASMSMNEGEQREMRWNS